MKRRSARPFAVEIKHTRTSRTIHADATAGSSRRQDLWHGQSLVADYKPAGRQPALKASSDALPPEAPLRRVLPSLVPTFAMPIEAEAPVMHHAPAVERLPRVRRLKEPAKRQQKPIAAKVGPAPIAPAESMARSPVTPVRAAPKMLAVPAMAAQPAPGQTRTARRAQQAATLRPGERWKRRLPRALW